MSLSTQRFRHQGSDIASPRLGPTESTAKTFSAGVLSTGILLAAILLPRGLAGCANGSGSGSSCDPALEQCACDETNPCPAGWDCLDGLCRASQQDGGLDGSVDAASASDAADAGLLKEFGDACRDKSECESGICLFTGTDGFCTRTCEASDCPEDFGCYGVLGIIEQGVVSQVCVPNTNLLCSPCQDDSECSTLGAHLCIDLGDGSYCGRDCSVEACPTGYDCQTVSRNGEDFQQCVPQSGSCNCDASLQGQTRPCTIQTPTGDCLGQSTCLGDQGWSDCAPPSSTDEPDDQYLDANCDGIDGDVTAGIFVATTGTDSPTCGLEMTDPCATIGHGLDRAEAAGRTYLFIQAGTYHEVVVLRSGIHLFGGYDQNWHRGDHNSQGYEVIIEGDLDQVDGQYLTIKAHDLNQPTVLSDLTLVGPDAEGSVNGSGLSSYVVHAKNAASLTLQHVTITAGNGADGADGADGTDAPWLTATAGMSGGSGGNANEFSTYCNDSDYGHGGAAGTNTCQGGSNPNGGRGGNGGTMDTDCGGWPDMDAQPGHTGANAATVGTNYGHGGARGGTCQNASAGQSGRVQNGSGGQGGAGSFLADDYWYARPGQSGGIGDNGTGGGGGGGSGGCDTGTDSYGAGGGGGGAGGCAARGGGGGGDAGGGSFGVFALFSSMTLTDCSIHRGNGGNGGGGGTGGQGQSGGLGGLGGATNGDSGVGGDGGNGTHGGHGGGGGGGAGGVSFGIYTYGSNVTQTCTFSGGAAGSGGQGGFSAPNAPVSERDGNPGGNGADAPAPADQGTCNNPNDC